MIIKSWLTKLSNTNTSPEQDSTRMANLLKRMGFPKARVVVGVVYPEGKGQPVSIHSMAKMLTELPSELSL